MKVADRVRLLILFLVTAVLSPLACDAGGIVGGSCRAGTTVCGERCTDLSNDPENCGDCGTICDADQMCSDGRCADASTGGTQNGGGGGTVGLGGTMGVAGEEAGAGLGGDGTTGGSGGAAGSNGTTGARGGAGGTSGRGGTSSGGRPPQGGASGQGGEQCLPPFDVPEQCGDCDTVCSPPTSLCAPNDSGGYECVPACEPPLEECGDQCVNKMLHPLHCGACFNVCPSGICQDGECVGASTGHIGLFCMNYVAVPRGGAHAVMLGNAVFLPLRNEVRILAFTRWAPGSVRAQVEGSIRATAVQRGRSGLFTNVTNAAEIMAELTIQNYDVFLVYEQQNAPAGQLATLGTNLRNSMVLDSFARAGGVIVVLDGAQGTGEMTEFIAAAGLLDVAGHSAIPVDDTTTRFFNRAPGDVLGTNVISPMSPVPFSCTFDTEVSPSPETVFVVTDAASPAQGSPVVVHQIVAP